MAVSAYDAAYRLCRVSNWALSPMAVQKVLYIAHMWHLGKTGGGPLIAEKFEAWDYGPVVPSLYRELKMFGRKPVQDMFMFASDIGGSSAAEAIDHVVNDVAGIPAGALVEFTHHKDGAWASHYVPGQRGIKIPNEDILKEYEWRPKKSAA